MSLATIGVVLENKQIVPGIFDMSIRWEGADQCLPGQFVNILCEGGGALLRRPISVCDAGRDLLRIVYEVKGTGTALLSHYEAGRKIDFLAPLGHGFTVKEAKNPILIGGGIGTYPLLLLAKQLKEPQIFLGFRSETRITLAKDFSAAGALHIATDDGSAGHHGLVTDLVRRFLSEKGSEMMYACGPKPMLKAVKALAEEFQVSCELSMEERMGCGIGACLVCACKTADKDGNWKHSHVCTDGPVFDAAEVIFE